MRKNFNALKASIVTGCVLIGVLMAVLPTTSAGLIFNFQSTLNVTWGNETLEPIVPRGEIRTLTLEITHTITRSVVGEGVLVTLTGALIPIHVSIAEAPSWCIATISQGTLSVIVQPNAVSTVETKLSIQVENNAPAYELGYIRVKAVADPTGLIAGYEDDFTLTFIAAYNPLIVPSLPETYVKQIGPTDTAVFPIDIANLGNARTIVLLNVVSVPNDWVAIVTPRVVLEEGAGSTGTAYLIVKPSRSFGYHNDEQTVQISMQPVKADDNTQKGEITYETFLVQSRGFSAPGFEIFLAFGAVAAALFVVYAWKRKK